jgi:hypothetical protein
MHPAYQEMVLTRKNVYIMAYISRTDPHKMFREVSSRALITEELSCHGGPRKKESYPHIVNPGRIKTTPADEMEL